jgi:4-hydroxybenzoate polyprenyltransferase
MILSKLYSYQKERFPLIVLLFTTLAVVISSAAIVLPTSASITDMPLALVVGYLTCLLFTFQMRVFDDMKDYSFDNRYHKDRPVQKHTISLEELNILNLVGIGIQALINVFYSLHAFGYWLAAFLYSLLAKAEFFAGEAVRKRFYLYNMLNLLQLFFLQLYLYAVIFPGFSWNDPLLYVHFVFVLLNAAILEFARKLKQKDEESGGKDTYSERLGIKKAATLFIAVLLLTYGTFSWLFFSLSIAAKVYFLSLMFLMMVLYSTFRYMRREKNTLYLQGSSVLFYLSLHFLLAV